MRRFARLARRRIEVPIIVLLAVAALSVVGVLADAGVFTFQSVQYGAINRTATKSGCWDAVLDHAVLGHHPRAELEAEARVCAQLR